MSKFCVNCGTELADDVAFCHICGAAVEVQAAPQQTYAQPQQTYAQPQQTYAQPQQPYVQPAPATVPGKGLAIAGMVCGIVSIFLFPWLLGTLGIIFGSVARYKGNRSGMATAGIVCGVIGIALWIVMLIACAGAVASLESMMYL